jgi:hypothetical protein
MPDRPVVIKLGGDALASPERILAAARRIRRLAAEGPVVAVASARRGVTDHLLDLVREVRVATGGSTRPHAEVDRAVATGEVVSAALLALIPWIGPVALLPAFVVAGALYRSMRRRHRGWTAFAAMEIVLLSAIVWITIDRRVFGGLTPYAASTLPHAPTGADGLAGIAGRWPRVLGVWVDPQVGALLYAPAIALAGATLWHAVNLRRGRMARAFPQEADVEATTMLLALVAGAGLLTAVVLAPSLAGRAPGEPLVVVLPFLAALAAGSLRRRPRLGGALALAGVVMTLWLLVAVRVDDRAGVSPVRGAVPWSAVAGDAPPRVR